MTVYNVVKLNHYYSIRSFCKCINETKKKLAGSAQIVIDHSATINLRQNGAKEKYSLRV